MNEDILPKTIEMLKASKLSMPAIATNTGLGVRWLHKLRSGEFQDPGFTKIVRLHGYLSADIEGPHDSIQQVNPPRRKAAA